MKIELSDNELKLLDEAYKDYGGVESYVTMELRGKLEDYVRQEKMKGIEVTAEVMAELAVKIGNTDIATDKI